VDGGGGGEDLECVRGESSVGGEGLDILGGGGELGLASEEMAVGGERDGGGGDC
jgi:hypothetical protein